MNLPLRNLILIAIASLSASPCFSASEPSLEGRWTGGFMLKGNWVAVNLRFASPGDSVGDRADILFPSYGGAENVLDVPLEKLELTPKGILFEIPVRRKRLRFEGDRLSIFASTQNQNWFSGNFTYGNATGTLGVTRWAYIPVDSLEKYYGAYRISPDHVISILRGWGHARTLNYVDYKTGQVGTLWPNLQGAFYSGSGLSVSYPIALKVTFDEDANGRVRGLSWKSWVPFRPEHAAWTVESEVTKIGADKLAFTEEQMTCRNGDMTIGGTLILPEGTGRCPVVIVTPGDYGTNRNQLRLWAHNYVSRGIAAFVFDSRGAGVSTGSVGGNSFSDLANDVLACVQALKARPEIDKPSHDHS